MLSFAAPGAQARTSVLRQVAESGSKPMRRRTIDTGIARRAPGREVDARQLVCLSRVANHRSEMAQPDPGLHFVLFFQV
jgi:hypothetical protein